MVGIYCHLKKWHWCKHKFEPASGHKHVDKLTVNSPVTASKPTWMVCSKSDGDEISGLSLSLSFFLPPVGQRSSCFFFLHEHTQLQKRFLSTQPSPFSEANIEMILFLDFLSSGTDGSGRELWLADWASLAPPWLLILTGGAGGLSSHTPLSHIYTHVHLKRHKRTHTFECSPDMKQMSTPSCCYGFKRFLWKSPVSTTLRESDQPDPYRLQSVDGCRSEGNRRCEQERALNGQSDVFCLVHIFKTMRKERRPREQDTQRERKKNRERRCEGAFFHF